MFNSVNELRKEMMLSKKTNPVKSSVLNMLLAETLNIAKSDKNREPTEKDIVTAVKKLTKMAEQSVQANVAGSEAELNILKEMQPQGMSRDEVYQHCVTLVGIYGKDMGNLMRQLKQIDNIDMKVASEIVKELIS